MLNELFHQNYKKAKRFKEMGIYEKFFHEQVKKYEFCIYGTGSLGRELCDWLIMCNISPSFFCDTDEGKAGNFCYRNIPCISLSELQKKKESVFVIVAVGNKKYNMEINGNLLDFTHIIRNPLGISIYWEQDFLCDEEEATALALETENMLCDEKSIRLYETLWKLRLQTSVKDYDSSILDPYYIASQYIVKDIIDYDRIRTYLDAGAYTGDSLDEFIALRKDAEVYCFEMDVKIFQRLKEHVEKAYPDSQDRIHLYPLGVSDKSENGMYFSDETGGSMRIEGYTNGTQEVGNMATFVALDDMDFQQKIDFIKMDIEGAEEDALLGAKELIRRDHPVLGISMYHSNTQFLHIPKMIKELDSHYQIYIRHHKYTLDDTVCYAIYKEN